MQEEQKLNPNHMRQRNFLRTVGPLVLVTGLVLTVIGIGNFFWSFGGWEPPRYFWCAFLGLPLIGIGAGLTQWAYAGSIFRYMTGETAPVAKDAFNYLGKGTGEGLAAMASAAARGLREGLSEPGEQLRCAKCGNENRPEAKFCTECGAPLAAETACPDCGTMNEAGARFCHGCGHALSAV